MFEAQVAQGSLWKKLIEAIKDLVTEANIDCNPGGTAIQAMDPSHVALVYLLLKVDAFSMYNCERNTVLGLNLASFSKVLKTTENNDRITLRHEDDSDVLTVVCDAPDTSKTSEFQLKLMEIEAEAMSIPDMEYKATCSIPSAEFAKICRDMAIFGDTVTIAVNREGVRFSSTGDIGEGFAFLKATGKADDKRTIKSEVKKEVKPEVKPEKNVKSETKTEENVKQEKDDDESPRAPAATTDNKDTEGKKKTKETDVLNKEKANTDVLVSMNEPVSLSFALRFLNTFAKGATLSDRVDLHLAKDSPCMVEYKIEGVGFLRYYLAPKVDETEA